MVHHFNFHTSHSQFYIYDKDSECDTASVNFWTDEAFNDRLAMEDGVLGVGTECYGPIKGELEFIDSINTLLDLNDFDHIVDGGLIVKSGIIQILDCPTSTVHLEVVTHPGTYRVRVYSSNLASVIGDEGNDFYRVEIWPDNEMHRTAVKRYF